MALEEPLRIALLLASLGVLMVASILSSRVAGRTGVPVALLFLGVGMLAGSGGFGLVHMGGAREAFRWGTVALVLILFDGGLNTQLRSLRRWIAPAAVLATAGVAGTAALVAAGARLLGFGWLPAFLLGSVVSSTDASSVFAVLRGSGISVRQRVAATLELESGVNDPAALVLTFALTAAVAAGRWSPGAVAFGVLSQLVIGAVAGFVLGVAGRWLLLRVRLPAGGLYPVLTLAVAFLAFGVPTLVRGSGFLAVYVAAVVIGNGPLAYRAGILRVHDAAAWFGQVTMFLVLGLLVSPARLPGVALEGMGLALYLAVVARPVAAFLCLLPFRFPLRETVYVGWVGLRGAVPIILATVPVMAGLDGAERIFHLVFFLVVVNVLVPGATVRWATRRLGLEAEEAPPPPLALEITATRPLAELVMFFHVAPALAVAGARIADLPFPDGAAVMLVVRGTELLAARGNTTLQPGDYVYVFCRPEDRAFVQLLFGRADEG